MEWFSESALRDLEVGPTLLNLVLVLFLGQILSLHYTRFANVLSNKKKFAPILLFIAATTMLVISVVKTSVALSLGLVGALSVIRFRTPVKEAEELAYLFLAVALGIGLGADQRFATSLMFLVILGALAVKRRAGAPVDGPRTVLHVNASLEGRHGEGSTPESALKLLLERVGGHAEGVDLRRVDARQDVLDASLILDLASAERVGSLIASVQELFPGASVSVVEASAVE